MLSLPLAWTSQIKICLPHGSTLLHEWTNLQAPSHRHFAPTRHPTQIGITRQLEMSIDDLCWIRYFHAPNPRFAFGFGRCIWVQFSYNCHITTLWIFHKFKPFSYRIIMEIPSWIQTSLGNIILSYCHHLKELSTASETNHYSYMEVHVEV